MLTIERHKAILNLLANNDVVSLQLLMDETKSSESTIRRDLSTLEKERKLVRVHGGAKRVGDKHRDIELAVKTTKYIQEKKEIAKKAAALIQPSECIYLDAGSTTLAMIPYLTQPGIIVVTNGLTHVPELIRQGIEVYMIGGFVKNVTYAAIGVQAKEMLERFNFDRAFIGINGIDIEQGLTTPDIEEAAIKSTAIKRSKVSYALADESKFDEITFAHVCELDDIKMITNQHNPYRKRYGKYMKEELH